MGGVSIIVAVLGFAFVIFIHELGHFLFAKWAGVKVERFSIGMGPIIWSRQIGETEYALSILPVGGYVKMLGQEDLPGQAADSEDQRSYTNKHPAWRAAILFAGVLFNIVSSYIILLVLAWYGMPVMTPQVGTVQSTFVNVEGNEEPTAAWEHNIHVGDRIIAVNGEKVRSFMDVMMYCIKGSTEEIELQIVRDGKEIPPIKLKSKYNPAAGRHTLGIGMPMGLRIAAVVRTGEEETADIKADDRIIGIQGSDENFDDMEMVGQQVYDRLHVYNGQDVTLILDRDGEHHEATIRYCHKDLVETSLGAMVQLGAVLDGKPAAIAGLKAGDYVSTVNSQSVINASHFRGLIRQATTQDQEVEIEIYRASAEAQGTEYAAQTFTMKSTLDEHTGSSIIGVSMSTEVVGPVLFSRQVPGADTTPLDAAGVKEGDILLDYAAERDAKGEPQELQNVNNAYVLRIGGGDIQQLELDKKVYQSLRKIQKLSFFAKVFGVKAQPSDWSGLMASRVVQAPRKEDPTLIVRHYKNIEDDLGESRQIDLGYFSEEQRASLYQLELGDWILRKNMYVPQYNEPSLV
ncbi:MAG: RIP metalloprotease RseP, partial [Planctomycetes bacterium]|nr:RIP metalloprotease RseP [Planctomycetota bacterium]